MPITVKELIVVIGISVAVFYFARPIATLFMTQQDFGRRRNVWYALTCAAFLSPSFWVCALIATIVLSYAAKKDSNSAALYVLVLHAIPPSTLPVPMIGMSSLFDLDINLLLSFCLLAPTAWRLARTPDVRFRRLRAFDILLASYGFLTSILYVRLQDQSGRLFEITFTDCLRRAFVFFFAIYLPYYVISRSVVKKPALVEVLASFCLSGVLMATIAMFESVRHWLLYPDILRAWNIGGGTNYLLRGDSLRAMASSGHPLSLGYLLAIAFGFWLCLQNSVGPRRRIFVSALLWLGLIASYSRGPWVGAIAIYFAFALLKPGRIRSLVRAVALSVSVLAAISISPLADKIIRVIPFLGGTIDSGNIVYRQRLFDRSWQIIEQSPMFGDQGALLKMQDLRQGEGIIDMVNTYLQILLDNGFVGLILFLAFISLAAFQAFVLTNRLAKSDPDTSQLGASLVACTVGTLIMIESGGSDRVMISVLVGLLGAYSCLAAPPKFPVWSDPKLNRTQSH